MFINGLAEDIKTLNKGISIREQNISILLYVDDIVLIAKNETDLQCMIDIMYDWCYKWKLKLNINKSNVVHFCLKNQRETAFMFRYGNTELSNIDRYQYV